MPERKQSISSKAGGEGGDKKLKDEKHLGYKTGGKEADLTKIKASIDNKRPDIQTKEVLDPDGYRLKWLGFTPTTTLNLQNGPSIDNKRPVSHVKKEEYYSDDDELTKQQEEEYRLRWLGYTPDEKQPNIANAKSQIDNKKPDTFGKRLSKKNKDPGKKDPVPVPVPVAVQESDPEPEKEPEDEDEPAEESKPETREPTPEPEREPTPEPEKASINEEVVEVEDVEDAPPSPVVPDPPAELEPPKPETPVKPPTPPKPKTPPAPPAIKETAPTPKPPEAESSCCVVL